jgi:hypothetical protein
MDNLGNSNHPANNVDKPIPLGSPPDGDAPSVSRAPLNLGAAGKAPAAPPAAAAPRAAMPTPVRRPVGEPVAASRRITGVKTFFTKLHPGALEFMDDQINIWLKEHPEICIKHTNITTGEVQAKKTEPNIIMTVWY